MPSGSYLQVYVQCPYYLDDDGKRRIHCEGLIPGSSMYQVYSKKEDFLRQIQGYCMAAYPSSCPACKSLNEKYPEAFREG